MNDVRRVERQVGGRTLSIETGKIAKQVFEAMWHGEGDADAMRIAAAICVYTNDHILVEEL